MTLQSHPSPNHPEDSGSARNILTFSFVTTGKQAGQLRPVIDGEDLLNGYRHSRGLPPDQLLPPLSTVLLPTREPRRVLIGSYSCGETGCGSLWLSCRRERDDILWEPVTNRPDETIRLSYRFALVDYLELSISRSGDQPTAGLRAKIQNPRPGGCQRKRIR